MPLLSGCSIPTGGARHLLSALAVTTALAGATQAQAAVVSMQNFNSLADFTLNGATASINTGA